MAAGGLRLVRYDRDLLADQRVHERGLADVRPPDDRDDPRAERARLRLGHGVSRNASGSSSPTVHRARSPLDVLGDHRHVVRGELRQDLAASPARRRRAVASGHDRHGLDPALARHDHGGHGVPLRADRERIARVLDVDARRTYGPRRGWPRRPRTRCTARRPLARFARGRDQTIDDVVADRGSSLRSTSSRWPSGSGCIAISTFAIRRPWTSSAVNVRPSNVTSSPLLGMRPNSSSIRPATVSHSSSGSSTSSSSFTSSIEALPVTR